LFPECLGNWISEDNPVRVIDVIVDELDLAELGFDGVEPEATGRPSYHPTGVFTQPRPSTDIWSASAEFRKGTGIAKLFPCAAGPWPVRRWLNLKLTVA
jgi:hypothetical protein